MYPQGPDQNPYAPQDPYAPQNPYAAQSPYAPQPPYAPQSPQGHNPYAPPVSDAWNDTSLYADAKPEGTYAGGFAVGFFFALIGLLIVHFVGKSETKRGALHGLGLRFGLGFLIVLLTR